MNTKHINIAGATVFWNCAVETDRERLRQSLEDLGFSELTPGQRTPFAAARRAAQILYPGAGYHIGSLKNRAGVAIERVVHADDTRNEYPQIGYLRVSDHGIDACEIHDPGLTPSESLAAEDSLRREFETQLRLCGPTAVGIALTKACERLGATRLRKNGGVFFVPEFSLGHWRSIARCFEEAASHGQTFVESLTVAMSDETLRGVLHSLREQITSRIEEIRDELKKGLAKRGRRNRRQEIEKLLSQSRAYETLLSTSLADVRGDLDALQLELTAETFASAANVFESAI